MTPPAETTSGDETANASMQAPLTGDMEARYDPTGIEEGIYQAWESAGLFGADPDAGGEPFVVVIPPPNVTAALHMGHGLNNTIQDVLVRRRRMQGRNTLWVPGTDHAGIATQNVVERKLRKEGKTRQDVGREAFVDAVWEWVNEYGNTIIGQLRRIGCSCDWERTRFTLDEGLSRAVREVFVRLYEQDLIYRGRYIINWCPRCRTALSNEEAEHQPRRGKLYRIRYDLVGGGHAEVATTRPETMLGDTGLAVHPSDERYSGAVGGEAVLPLVGRVLPVVADRHVDPEFGSGVVKVTPAHDANDFEIGKRHGFSVVDVMTDGGRMSEEAGERYAGLDRFEARNRVVGDLEAEGRLISVSDHDHSVGKCYRCANVVEPRLSLQWFVRMKPLAEPALRAYENGEIRIHPARYGKIYGNWMSDIRDWCISRQLWWGHRIPVWYCEDADCGEMVVAMKDPTDCPRCRGKLRQDEDVLDTWFSSWLWPFSTLGWPDQTPDLKAFYPTHALVTAPEILFFWVARMVMAGFQCMGEAPFRDVLLHGTVRDHEGRRMSKSLGNGIDPLEAVERFGADAMRFTLIRGAPLGTDLQLNYKDLETAFRPGRNFANKIWNAARFALQYAEAPDPEAPGADGRAGAPLPPTAPLRDRWIWARLGRAQRAADDAYEELRLHEAAEIVHQFIWGDFCDWYLEMFKHDCRANGGGPGSEASSGGASPGQVLTMVMRGWLSMLHPIMPFLTEAIFRRLPGCGPESTLVRGPWPETVESWTDSEAEAFAVAVQEPVDAVRALRPEYGISPGAPVTVRVRAPSPALSAAWGSDQDPGQGRAAIAGLGGIARLSLNELDDTRPGTDATSSGVGVSAQLPSGAELFLPLSGLVDLDRERAKLEKELAGARGRAKGAAAKLANPGFVANAPAEVVERERRRVSDLEALIATLTQKLRTLRGG